MADGIECMIDQVCIKPGGYVSYGLSWWDERSRREGWFYPNQIRPVGTSKQVAIGFSKGTNE